VNYGQNVDNNYALPNKLTPNSNSSLETSFTFASFLGLTNQTDPNASQTNLQYDAYGRLASISTVLEMANGAPAVFNRLSPKAVAIKAVVSNIEY